MHPADLFPLFPAGQGTRGRATSILCALHDIRALRATVEAEISIVEDVYENGTNIYVKCGSPAENAPVLEAHYDVFNPAHENCLDNTASVCHLLALAHDPLFNGYLAFCDGEELVDFEGSGAFQLARKLETSTFFGADNWRDGCRFVLCLELTAVGDIIWSDMRWSDMMTRFHLNHHRRCPFNDATILRQYGILGVQISITPAEQFFTPRPANWSHCHKPTDTFSLANRDDMAKFQEWLKATNAATTRSSISTPGASLTTTTCARSFLSRMSSALNSERDVFRKCPPRLSHT